MTETVGRSFRGPHPREVLLAVEGVDHGPRREEEEPLEDAMGQEVEHPGCPETAAEGHEHVPDLAHRRIGEHPLDVALAQGAKGGVEGRDETHGGDDGQHGGGLPEEGRHAAHEVPAGVDHGGRVDQGRDRRGTLHGVGQPEWSGNWPTAMAPMKSSRATAAADAFGDGGPCQEGGEVPELGPARRSRGQQGPKGKKP